MRPLKIVITGFGTYCNRTQIDLEAFGKSGLYLITGDTGSGKTTIFDAITFALYGEPSGTFRSTSMMRSSYATPDIPTEVELDFEFRGKLYKIKRNPEYERKSIRGDSLTTQAAGVEFTLPDGKILTKKAEVSEKIIELLGINREQFSQIVMIAQGDFQKLLAEKTEDRHAILRKIFKTDNFQILQEKLSEMEHSLKALCFKNSESLNQYMNDVRCDEKSEFLTELENAKKSEIAWNEKIEIINKIISEDEKTIEKLCGQRAQNQKNLDKFNVELSEVENIKIDIENLKKTEQQILQKKYQLEILKKCVEEKSQIVKKNAEKTEKLALIKNDIQKYDELEKAFSELNKLKGDSLVLEKKCDELSNEKVLKTDFLKKLEDENRNLLDAGEKRAEYNAAIGKLENQMAEFIELEECFSIAEKKSADYKKLQEEYLKVSDFAEKIAVEYRRKNKEFLDSQAGILAKELKDNHPCPVCGSVHHPNPAKVPQSVVSDKELELLRIKSETAEKEYRRTSENAAVLKNECEEIFKKLSKDCKKVYETKDFELEDFDETSLPEQKSKILELCENTKALIDKNKNLLDSELKKIERHQLLEEKIPIEKEQLEKLEKELGQLNNHLIQHKTKIEADEKSVEQMKKNLQFSDRRAAVNEIEKIEESIKIAESEQNQALEKFIEEQNDIKALEGKAEELKKRTEKKDISKEVELIQSFEKLKNEKEQLEEEYSKLYSQNQSNKSALENILVASESFTKKQKEFQLVSALSNTANGKLAQRKAKIMLETYVQMTYFDRIIAHANKRFLIMSDGQYELTRKKIAADARSQAGLDLNVIDHWKGDERDVKTLSGGESFQASLSLALGLSDEIACSSGGIKIDTMFVDEGFGTLDADALQKAYSALAGISENGRLVGIISHVDYLKEKIDRQIVVTKSRTGGSSVTLKV